LLAFIKVFAEQLLFCRVDWSMLIISVAISCGLVFLLLLTGAVLWAIASRKR